MTKRTPQQFAEDLSGKTYWRSLDEHADSPELAEELAREFPEGAAEPPEGVSRRDFFTVMGASFAMAGLAGCRRPEEKILPYARAPEEMVPGNAMYYATAMAFHGTAVGLLVESHEGRPTKIEGNPKHPDSQGAISPFIPSSILEMYDPDRSDAPSERTGPTTRAARTWPEAIAALRKIGDGLKQKQGAGFAILTEAHRSPTFSNVLTAARQVLPQARHFRYDPFARSTQYDGARLAFGRPFETVLDVAASKVLVTLDADILATDGSVVKNAKGWAASRKSDDPAQMGRHYAIEASYTVTGGAADHRLRLAARDVAAFVSVLAVELNALGVNVGGDVVAALSQKRAALSPLSDSATQWARVVAKDLAARRGQGLIVAGTRQPATVHAVCYLINSALGNTGKTIHHVKAFDETPAGPQGITELAAAIRAGTIDTVLVLGGNPAFNAPADAMFADTLAQAPTTIHVGLFLDETGQACSWHLNQAHFLEAWSDVRAENGLASIVQPLIAPLFDGRTEAEILAILLGRAIKAYDLVRGTWQQQGEVDFERRWRKALHEGFLEGSAHEAAAPPPPAAMELVAQLNRALPPADGFEVTFLPDNHTWDGRFANISWMQEWPDPISKQAWGNAAYLSKTTAAKLGVKEKQLISIKVRDAQSSWMSVNLPVVIQPGHPDDSVGVMIGQGRRFGRVAKGIGVDTTVLRTSAAFGFGPVDVAKVGGHRDVARTQEHFRMEGRALVREATAVQFKQRPEMIKEMVAHVPHLSLYKDFKYEGHKWGMAIDLNTCIGCGGCMVACQAENNIPVVGATELKRSREMHWIRVDRYYEGTIEDPMSLTQPMTCQQCENAPCEPVCPVAATTHSPEGLNDMAYNRCIGTRYCANNCPWKVRRFNYFHYNKKHSELRRMAMNPDVTVRSRGVMEKCTWCVQRINRAKIGAHTAGNEWNEARDGAIVPACAQSCPTNAITFGDLNDPKSPVAQLSAEPRAYRQLEELNTRPRLSYVAKIRNPNPELA